jgi:hypothetical protein
MIDALPKDVWALIRSFSGDTGYEPTATAKLMKDLTFICGSPLVGGKQFLSTLVMAKDADFLVIYRDLFGNYLPDVSRKHFIIFTREEKDARNV